jgi:Na+/proline symporter
MALWDVLIIAAYFVTVMSLGFWYRKRASQSLKAYFLGGKRLHWLPLAMSGSVSNFDITGTMWIVSILFVLGMKSMWHHWMWGFLMGAFFLAYMGGWVRRSGVMTAAEWMKTRFGDGPGGRLARTTYALMAVLTQASFIGYAYQGIGKFASVYLPLERLAETTDLPWLQALFTTYESDLLAVAIIGVTTLYVMLGGLFSVVITDVFQTVILTVGSVVIAWIAFARLTPDLLAGLPGDFTSLGFSWRLPEMAGTPHGEFEFFGGLVIVWVLKGLLLNAGGPGQMYDFQRFLSARDPRDAAKVGAAWSAFLVVRWAMAIGIALLALTGAVGVTDSEKVMPVVLRDFLPVGLRGVVVAGLLAAFMSTFSSTVNSGASFIVRDLWQACFKPRTTERGAVRFSYLATGLLVLLGIGIGFQGESIARIWGWIMMALGGGVVIPNVLRWYWWRMNGFGYALGTLGGIVLALVAFFQPQTPVYVLFPLIVAGSFLVSVIASFLTAPVDRAVLTAFYGTVRPFGLWRRIKHDFDQSGPQGSAPGPSHSRILLNLVLAMAAIWGCYLFPMYLVGHWYGQALLWGALALSAMVALKFTWYDHLARDGDGEGEREQDESGRRAHR